MTLTPPARIYSFESFVRANPRQTIPGDRLDAQFQELIDAIRNIQGVLAGIVRSDGELRSGSVKPESLDPKFKTDLFREITSELKDLRALVQATGEAARLAREGAVEGQAVSVETSLLARATVLEQDGASAAAYAQAAKEWAEHMPDTLPADTVAIMGVTGNHWSSRWWAEQALLNSGEGSGGGGGGGGGGAGVIIQDTPPAPVHGQLWWESDTGALYVSYNDGDSQAWVQINGTVAGAGSGPGATAPANAVPPIITGPQVQGQVLTVSQGAWTNNPVGFIYQWFRDNIPILEATAAAYLLQAADVGAILYARITAINGSGETTTQSNTTAAITGAVPAAPVNTTLPAITGTETQGQTLTVSNGTWSNSPTSYSRQWFRAQVAISGATSATYVLQAADVGAIIHAKVTATNASGSTTAQSNSTGAISAPASATPLADARAAAIITRGGSQSSTTIAAVQQLEKDLALAGLTAKFVYFNPRCGNDLIAARSPLIATNGPGYDTQAGTFSTWVEGKGLAGSSGVMDTGVNAEAAGLTVISSCMGIYMMEDAKADTNSIAADYTYVAGEKYLTLVSRAYGQYMMYDAFGATGGNRVQTDASLFASPDSANTKGLICGSRYSATAAIVARNGVIRGLQTAAADLLPPTVTRKVYTAPGASGGDFIGFGLTPDDVSLLFWVLHEFNTALGRAVMAEGVVGINTVPNPFSFTDTTGVPLSSVSTSNSITVSGLTPGLSTAVTVTGGEYAKNGGAWSTVATTAVNTDTFVVRHTNSAADFTATNTTLTIGGVSDTFTSTTTGAVAPVVWNPATSSDQIIVSGPQNRTANRTEFGGPYISAKSATSQSAGLRYVEVHVDILGSPGTIIGVAGTAASSGSHPGADNFGVGYANNYGAYYKGGGSSGVNNPGAYVTGDVIGILVDFTAKTVKMNLNNGTFSATVDITSLGTDVFIFGGIGAGTTSQVTLNNPLIYPLPGGATKWDGTT